MKQFTVRPMTREDLPAVAELEKLCFSEPWSLAQLSDSLHRQEYTFLVATEEADPSRVAGYLGARIVLDEMDIANVAVFPEYRKQGVASAMLDRLLETAEERELYGVTLEVRVGNEPAIFLYEKKGFVREGVRPKFYSRPTEDALIMWKYLR
ncbi:MAG: ribosomal protein S18-alanine N-acetyltransferase [Lachnospiraceae bacterium]|nr:ribosomal protein S18-alanine N-acetyltransferase [Lachnospiraceae bacterium]